MFHVFCVVRLVLRDWSCRFALLRLALSTGGLDEIPIALFACQAFLGSAVGDLNYLEGLPDDSVRVCEPARVEAQVSMCTLALC